MSKHVWKKLLGTFPPRCRAVWLECWKDHVGRGPRNAGEAGLELPGLLEPSADSNHRRSLTWTSEVSSSWATQVPNHRILLINDCFKQLLFGGGLSVQQPLKLQLTTSFSYALHPKSFASQILSKLKSNLLFFPQNMPLPKKTSPDVRSF